MIWSYAKKIQLPHQENCSWGLTILGLSTLVEAMFVHCQSDLGENRQFKDNLLYLARVFNGGACNFGDRKVVHRKLKGFDHGLYGYEKDIEVPKILNEELVDQGNILAIQRKVQGPLQGIYYYQTDHSLAYILAKNG